VLRVTSANLSGAMPAASAVATLRDVGLEADAVFDDGPSPGGTPSTVVRIAAGQLEILRAGAIGDDTIRRSVREGEP
jgi:tRNA A37 threonylcarbamoyladenosine synthetase subunit TsaC/SUA5/YrdC